MAPMEYWEECSQQGNRKMSSETWNNQMKAGGPSWVARRGGILARF